MQRKLLFYSILNFITSQNLTPDTLTLNSNTDSPYLKISCPKPVNNTSIYSSLAIEITSNLNDFQKIIVDFLDENESGLDSSLVTKEKLLELLPNVLTVNVGACVVPALRVLNDPVLTSSGLLKYTLEIEDFRSTCNSQEFKKVVNSKSIYAITNSLNFQLQASTKQIYENYQVTKKLQDNFIVKYQSAINCEYLLEYDVNLDTEYFYYDRDIRTPLTVPGFKQLTELSVNMEIFTDGTFSDLFDLDAYNSENNVDYDQGSDRNLFREIRPRYRSTQVLIFW